jgi:hypothetical protein
MSATELLEKAERFLDDHTVIEGQNEQSLELSWQTADVDQFAGAVDAISAVLSPPTENSEHVQPTILQFAAAKLSGTSWSGPKNSRLRREVWTLTDGEFPRVAHWLDEYESSFPKFGAGAYAHKHVAFRWAEHHRVGKTEWAERMVFGVNLTRPRSISMLISFYDADHYRRIKKYMSDIGLATLIDKYVRPKRALDLP